MLNRIFKTKRDIATGNSYAVSELGKNHNTKATHLALHGLIFIGLAGLSNTTQAACPTPAPATAVVQIGESCSYDGSNFQDRGRANSVIDIRDGGSATFSAENVSLHKTNRIGSGSPFDYTSIYLREAAAGLSNRATFQGNVKVEKTAVANTRDIIVGGGSNLVIEGDLAVAHNSSLGTIFDLGRGWNNSKRADTFMTIKGKFNGVTEGSDFIRADLGHFVFEQGISLSAKGGKIRVDSPTIEFKGDNGVYNTGTFLDISSGKTPTISFNNLVLKNEGTEEVFALRGGTTSFNGEATLTTPTADMIKLYSDATLNNNAILSVVSKDGVAIHAVPNTGKVATFTNTANASITNGKSILVNDGEGIVSLNNDGLLKTTESGNAIFKNTASGTIWAVNNENATLHGTLSTTDADTLNLHNRGTWENTDNSSVDSLINTGTVAFVSQPDGSHRTLSVNEYTGGGNLVINSVWNNFGTQPNGISSSDLLKINRINGTDVTRVSIAAPKLGTITPKRQAIFSTNVIEVENDHSGNLFVGSAATNSPIEAQLLRDGNNYRWTLIAVYPPKTPPVTPPALPVVQPPVVAPVVPAVTPAVLEPVTPAVVAPVTPAVIPTVLQPSLPAALPPSLPPAQAGFSIISQPVVGYIQQPYINREMGLAHLGQLHQRRGEQQNHSQAWGRLRIEKQALQGQTRFGTNVNHGLVQFGKDLAFSQTNENVRYHSGVTATYGWANSAFFDKYRAENGVVVSNKYTGKAKAQTFSLGSYHTYISPTGFYVDSVTQASFIHNRYHSQTIRVSQSGYGLGASVEVGKPYYFPTNARLAFEPQAQLSYQWIDLANINDGIRQVRGANQHSLTARLGTRLTWNQDTEHYSPNLYASADFIQTLLGRTSEIQVGPQKIGENFSGLAVELGLGGQYPITSALSLYGDARYTFSLDNHHNSIQRSSQLAKQGYQANMGIKYSW